MTLKELQMAKEFKRRLTTRLQRIKIDTHYVESNEAKDVVDISVPDIRSIVLGEINVVWLKFLEDEIAKEAKKEEEDSKKGGES